MGSKLNVYGIVSVITTRWKETNVAIIFPEALTHFELEWKRV